MVTISEESSLRNKQRDLVTLMQQLQGKLQLRDKKILELKGEFHVNNDQDDEDEYETGDEYM